MSWKRAAVWGLAVVMCLMGLVSCGTAPKTPVADGFRCKVTLDYGGAVYEGTLDRLQPSQAALTLTKPEALDGLQMTWNGDTVSMMYAGMTVSFEEGAMPVGTAVKVLCRALDACRAATEPSTVCEGTLEGIPFTATFDDQTGMPLTLSLPSVPLKAAFSSWEVPSASES